MSGSTSSLGVRILQIVIVALVYCGAASVGLSLAYMPGVSLVWPPTGIALALMLLLGYRIWPAISLGAFSATALTLAPLVEAQGLSWTAVLGVSLGVAVGNTLEAVGAVCLLRWLVGFQGSDSLRRVRDVLGLLVAAVLSTMISATIGTVSFCLAGVFSWQLFGLAFGGQWLGYAMGDLIVAPLILIWSSWPRWRWRSWRATEAMLLALLLVASGGIAFGVWMAPDAGRYPLEFLPFPLVMWAALRFGPRGATTASLIVVGLAVWGTLHRSGEFAAVQSHEQLVAYYIFASAIAITALLTAAAMSERRLAEQALRESEERYRDLSENANDLIQSVALDGSFLYVNRAWRELLGYDAQQVKQLKIQDILHPDCLPHCLESFRRVLAGDKLDRLEATFVTRSGRSICVEGTANCRMVDGQAVATRGIFRDVTERKQAEEALQLAYAGLERQVQQRTADLTAANEQLQREISERTRAEQLLTGSNQALEQLAMGAPLTRVLTTLVETIENSQPGLLCSILLVDRQQRCLRQGAAPRLPDAYNQAIDGLAIGPGVGCCGTAAFTGQRVIAEDVQQHPYWSAYRDLAQRSGLRACWSQPVFSSHDDVLGTFAVYHAEPHDPDQFELDLVQSAAQLAGIAIQSHQSEEELRKSLERNQQILQTTMDGYLLFDAAGNLLDVNPAYCRMSGYSRYELITMNLRDLQGRLTPDELAAKIADVMEQGGAHFENEHRCRDGRVIQLDVSVRTMETEGAPLLAAFVRDITRRKHDEVEIQQLNETLEQRVADRTAELASANRQLQHEVAERCQAERALRESEERLRAIYDNTTVGISVGDPHGEGRLVESNRAYERFLGYDHDELLGKRFSELTHPQDVAKDERAFQQMMSGAHDSYEFEKRYLRKDGQTVWGRLHVSVVRDESGEPKYNFALIEDITDRKRAEEEVATKARRLAQSEKALLKQTRILQSILDSIAEGVTVVDEEGEFILFNPAAEQILGRGAKPSGPQQWPTDYGLFLPDGVTPHPVDDLPLLRAMQGETVREQELLVRHDKLPGLIWLSVNSSPLVDGSGKLRGGVAVFRDITRHKEDEARISADERMMRNLLDLQDRERKLIAYEIHDGFVQHVVGAQMTLEGAAAELREKHGLQLEELDQVRQYLLKAIEEGRLMISELRPLIIDEQGIVEGIHYLAEEGEAKGGLNIQFQPEVSFDRLPPLLEGNLFRIVQEALNNVRRHSHADRADVRLRQVGDWIQLEIQDRGVGFDPHEIGKERFGLEGICRRAQLFGGRADIQSSPGGGTRVFVELPIAGPSGGNGET